LERAKELVKNAKESIGAEQDEVTEIRLKSLAQQILHLRQLIKTQTKAMKDFCPFPEIEIIESFKGISEFSAVGLMLVIDNIERFKYCEKSIKKKLENGNGKKPDKNRRYQERDQSAPISRRQQKKRKQLQLVRTQQIDNKENGKTDKQMNSQGMLKKGEKA
jgi:hypothetical protein